MKTLNITGSFGAILAMACLIGCESASAADPIVAAPAVNYEGLGTVAAKRVDITQIRPGVDFAAYSAVRLAVPELAFQTPDRSQSQFPLNETQKQRFRKVLPPRKVGRFYQLENKLDAELDA